MNIFDRVEPLQSFLSQQKGSQKTIGLVPTMGALHEGHAALLAASKKQNDLTVCSIYVNPTQFNDTEDLLQYPRTLEADRAKLEALGCEVLFCPSDKEMYASPPTIKFDFGQLAKVMEGQHRPGHFNGVALVVAKLFHQIQPDRAYFGQKDLQQFLIIQRLVQDLSFNLSLEGIPIVREEDGLALSSRNQRLNPKQRIQAPQLYQALQRAAKTIQSGKDLDQIRLLVENHLKNLEEIELEYFQIVNANTLEDPIGQGQNQSLALCLAASLGSVRLIDNLIIIR